MLIKKKSKIQKNICDGILSVFIIVGMLYILGILFLCIIKGM